MRRLRRILIRVVLATGLVLGLGLILLHTPPGRRLVRSVVEGSLGAAAGGRLSLASLDYSLWAGRLDTGGASFTGEGKRVEIGALQLRWPPGGGLRARLLRPRVVLRDRAGRSPRPAQRASRSARFASSTRSS